MITLIQQLCRSLRAQATSRRYQDVGIGLAFIILNQLIIIPIQIMLNFHSINLPASILVMLLSSFLMILANYIHDGTAQLYDDHIRGPTDFLGRHMSFGFVASFIMLNRDHISDAVEVPKVAGAFVITTLISYIASFLVASGSFRLEKQARGQRKKTTDLESCNKSWPSPPTAWPAPPINTGSKPLAPLSRISMALVNGSIPSIESSKSASASQFIDLIIRSAPLWICVFLLILVGVPVYFATTYEAPFEALCFVLFWTVSVQFQRSLKCSCRLLRFPRLRSTLVVFANPVLVTWALGTTYLWIKTAYTERDIGTIVTEFRRHDTLAEGIVAITEGGSLAGHIGAGDLAGPILDAGIVCLGFKMFEYRKELWESLFTVFTTCAVLAVINVFINVLVARALGLPVGDAIAFAARSVTIALGVPAIQTLGGSTTLMGAMVIFGGIIFQMAGDWLFSLIRIDARECRRIPEEISSSDPDRIRAMIPLNEKEPQQRNTGTDNAVVAAGVTVGINAAAMGTAYLIERDSRATAYSALSMTVFGALTVTLAALPGVAETIASIASR